MTIKELINNYYLPNRKDLAPSTIVGYQSAIDNHILSKWGDVDCEDINVFDLEEWLSRMSGGCARKVWSVFRLILRAGYDWGYINNDVGKRRLRLPKKAYYRPPTLTANELRELLIGFYGEPLEAWVICSACIGLRRGESCGLRWKDIDLRSGEVNIHCSVQNVKGEILELDVKTEKSHRSIFLPPFAIKRLREIKGKRNDRLIGDMSPSQAANTYKKICQRKHLPYVPPSNLRHSYASIALKSGVPPQTVANILGHTDLTMIFQHYLVEEKSIYQNAAKSFEKMLMKKMK